VHRKGATAGGRVGLSIGPTDHTQRTTRSLVRQLVSSGSEGLTSPGIEW